MTVQNAQGSGRSTGWSCGVVRASSLEEHQTLMGELWDTQIEPLSTGGFTSKGTFLAMPSLVVYRVQWDRPLHQTAALAKGRLVFAIPPRQGFSYSLQGNPVGSDRVPWGADRTEIDMVTTNQHVNTVMVVDADYLQRIAERVQHPIASQPPPSRVALLPAMPDRIEKLSQNIDWLLGSVEQRPAGRILRKAKSARFDEQLTDALLDALMVGDDRLARGLSVTATERYRLVQTCLEYARHKALEVTIPELCKLVGKSRRTLEYAFREVTTTSPARYLHLCRLREVNRVLSAGRPGETTVTAAATRWGFFELGRFAGAYRETFGELPSETLQRAPRRGESIPDPRSSMPSLPSS